jgi:hypothetical protein
VELRALRLRQLCILAFVVSSWFFFRECQAGPGRLSVTDPSSVTDIVNLYIRFTTSVHDGARVRHKQSTGPGPTLLEEEISTNHHEDATKAGMHSCRSRRARSSTAVLRHRVSSTRSHSPGPFPWSHPPGLRDPCLGRRAYWIHEIILGTYHPTL